ncbi:MAG: hypothetical protein IJP62_06705 [Treponema sp.]|nr:hypothetical protein [Treponema sp.]
MTKRKKDVPFLDVVTDQARPIFKNFLKHHPDLGAFVEALNTDAVKKAMPGAHLEAVTTLFADLKGCIESIAPTYIKEREKVLTRAIRERDDEITRLRAVLTERDAEIKRYVNGEIAERGRAIMCKQDDEIQRLKSELSKFKSQADGCQAQNPEVITFN